MQKKKKKKKKKKVKATLLFLQRIGWLFCFMVYQPFSGRLTPN